MKQGAKKTRGEAALWNMISGMGLQMVLSVSGILLPHFFLLRYGSGMNGMVSSVGQCLSYLALVESGISAAAVVELYDPVSRNDVQEQNMVLTAAGQFYFRSGIVYLLLLLALAAGYPYLIGDQMDAATARSIVLILAVGNLADYLFFGKYRVLLTAQQKTYVTNLVRMLETALNIALTIGLIWAGCSILLVKAVTAGLAVLRMVLLACYVKRTCRDVNFHTASEVPRLRQRRAVLIHQIAGVVVFNTDMIVLTVCMGARSLTEVSVYVVYNLVAYGVSSLLDAFTAGLTAGFGDLLLVGSKEDVERAYADYEYLYYMVMFCAYGCMSVLLLPFIGIYTAGITDAVYVRPVAAGLFILIGLLQSVRKPAQTMISACGHYEQTAGRALVEAGINLGVSLLLVRPFGMPGVLAGTVCSFSYRSMDTILYNRKYLLPGNGKKTLRRVLRNLMTGAVTAVLLKKLLPDAQSWSVWFTEAVLTGTVMLAVLFLMNCAAEPDAMKRLLERGRSVIRK